MILGLTTWYQTTTIGASFLATMISPALSILLSPFDVIEVYVYKENATIVAAVPLGGIYFVVS